MYHFENIIPFVKFKDTFLYKKILWLLLVLNYSVHDQIHRVIRKISQSSNLDRFSATSNCIVSFRRRKVWRNLNSNLLNSSLLKLKQSKRFPIKFILFFP